MRSLLAAAVGLLFVLIIGDVSWQMGSGITCIVLGAFSAAGVAIMLRSARKTVSILAAGFGSGVASFLAIATAERLPPGSTEWMLKGGLYGAAVGLPLAFVLGTVGLIECKSLTQSSGGEHQNGE